MRTLPTVAIVFGLALLTAACGSPQRTAAPSGAAEASAPTGDSIDRFAASYEQQRGRRY
jgi:hypothetical protein